MLTQQEANAQVERLTKLLRQVVVAMMDEREKEKLKYANYILATVPKDWFERVDAATTYVPLSEVGQ